MPKSKKIKRIGMKVKRKIVSRKSTTVNPKPKKRKRIVGKYGKKIGLK